MKFGVSLAKSSNVNITKPAKQQYAACHLFMCQRMNKTAAAATAEGKKL